MWSKPLLCRFRQPEENPLSPVPQGFAGFCPSRAWIGSTHSQTRPDTNFAIPGYSLFRHYTTSKKKIKVFSVRARSYGQTRFCAALSSQPTSRKRSRRKALRRFVLPCSGYRHGTPKCGTVPTPPYPDRGVGYAARSRTAYLYYIRFSPVLQGGNQPFRAAFRATTRSVASQRTPRSSRPMWP